MTDQLPWEPGISIPASLTVSLGEALGHSGDPLPWCTARAAELLGSAGSSRQRKRLAQCLEKYVTQLRKNGPLITAALFFYPDFTHLPPWGVAEVEAFGEHSTLGPLTMKIMREFYETPDELSFGETELTETEVPAGAALRVHRFRKAEPDKRRSRIGEELVWLIWPPDTTAVIAIEVRWFESAYSEAATNIADDMARSFHAKPRG
jgi:hypothetical protein